MKGKSTQWLAGLLLLITCLTLVGIFIHAIALSAHGAPSSPPELTMQYPPVHASQAGSDVPSVKIAHAVSLISCSKHVEGYLAALAILRHSIHLQSVHTGKSRYDYQMYAIIHQTGGCQAHVDRIRSLGYVPLTRPTPVDVSNIRGDYYRTHVEGENCCGSKEFIKLYAYELLDQPISVHWDVDVAVLQPMDDLFDAMLFPKDSPRGQVARSKLLVSRPSELPDRIDAFFTRDVTSSRPWEPHQGVQGGFMVARTDASILPLYRDIILEGKYTPGRTATSGWGGLGYGGFQGAMAIQGIYAYFYDQIHRNRHVELDYCRWNQCAADVIWRGPLGPQFLHQCRLYPADGKSFDTNTPENGKCEDCRFIPVDEVKTVHYTACKKPWECRLPHPRNPKDKREVYRLQNLVNVTTCGNLFRKYFEIRKDLEERIAAVSRTSRPEANGAFSREYFLGYCNRGGSYVPLTIPDNFEMNRIYETHI